MNDLPHWLSLKSLKRWEMKCQLMGLMGREAAVAIIQTLELPIKAEEYMSSSQQIMAQMFPSCHLLPG